MFGNNVKEIRKTMSVDYEIPSEMSFKKKPFKHQVEAFLAAKDREYFAYLCEMRTGKSKMLVDEVSYLYKSGRIDGLVLVTMTTLCAMWATTQLPENIPDDITTRVCLWRNNTKAFERELALMMKPTVHTLDVLLMNVEAVKTDRGYGALLKFLKTHKVLFAIDESTIIKGQDSDQSKICRKLGKLAKYRRILTGSPSPERPLDVYAQFDFLKEGCLGHTSFFSFKNRYAVTQTKYVNGRKFQEIIGYQRLDELQKKISECSYRKLRRECFDIPENRYPLYVQLSPEQKKFYDTLRDDALAWLDSGEPVTAPLVITRLMRLRQALCNIAVTDDKLVRFISDNNPRMDVLLQALEEAGDKKVIIWSNFTPAIVKINETIARRFGKKSTAMIYGGVSPKERDDVRLLFQDKSSDLRFLPMQPGIGGFGLDLTASDTMIYHDHDWPRLKREQSETRVLGPMQTSTLITNIDLVAMGTLDEDLIARYSEKKELSDQVTGDNLRQLLKG